MYKVDAFSAIITPPQPRSRGGSIPIGSCPLRKTRHPTDDDDDAVQRSRVVTEPERLIS